MKYVWHGMDVGTIRRYRLVDKPWQYEALVHFGGENGGWIIHGDDEWIPVIELSFGK